MYKIKSVSRGSATIKFPKQAEMNYQAVCFLNEIQNRFFIPYTVTLKHSKVLVKFENQSGTAYRDVMAGHTELIAAVRTTAELLKQLYGIFEQCSAAKLDPRGIVFRADCICIERDGAVKVMYAPGFDFDPSHSLQNLFSEIHGFFGGNENAYNDLYTSFSVFNSSGSEGANRYLNDLISNKLSGTPSPVSNEGETTILSPRVARVSNEGETTVLNPGMANVSNEGETTVLSPNMNMRGFAPEEDDYNENSTVLMTEENGGMLEQEPVNPV
ncbi:MAG: hypothetical protein LUG85_05805, partial [Clostridiales bacterium]|nr:hypothetical protein [Clostridiales bacterium]